ncbi:MAG: hypothetical protein IKX00_01070 [Bacilli bacterium]|nr:hypothetical protein [Bacilli bacterium]
MQSNIFELIDLLVKMSSSKSNIDELKADLDDTLNNISLTEDKLKQIESEMTDDKYFDASSEIVDRNIKISLVKKIQKLNKIKTDLERELDQVKEDERNIHSKIEDIKKEIDEANSYNAIISTSSNNKESFTNMLASENERITDLLAKKEDFDASYSKIQKKVEYLSNSLLEVNDKIEKETDRLNEIDHNLSNIKAYIDFDAKEDDEKEYLSVKNDLELLINHRDQITNDPVYIASLIKEHIANDDKDNVEKEFNHLIEIVKEIPYMSLENNEIEVEMKKLDDELRNYDSEISQKDYQTLDAVFIEDRILYLEDSIKNNKDLIRSLTDKKGKLEYENEVISEKIYRSEVQIKNINKSLSDYDEYDYECGELSKSVVQAANNKLVEEKNNISEITANYRSDLVKNINEIKIIDDQLTYFNNEVVNKESELDELNKKLALNTSSKNILEEEKDKLALEKINSKINSLKFREEFNKSLSEILEEFEMLNSSLEFVDKKTRVQRNLRSLLGDEVTPLEEIIPFQEPEIKSDEVELPTEEKVEDEPHGFMVPDEKINETSQIQVEEVNEIPQITDEELKNNEPKEEKLRVVEIIPISDTVTEKEPEKDFMVNDFQDDDYVDFESAISEVGEK